jgi:hypothetical protein
VRFVNVGDGWYIMSGPVLSRHELFYEVRVVCFILPAFSAWVTIRFG